MKNTIVSPSARSSFAQNGAASLPQSQGKKRSFGAMRSLPLSRRSTAQKHSCQRADSSSSYLNRISQKPDSAHLQGAPEAAEQATIEDIADRFNLLPHQKEALTKMADNYQAGLGTLVAHEMGLGKTRTSLSYLEYMFSAGQLDETDTVLVLTRDSNLMNHWVDELNKMQEMSQGGVFPHISYLGHGRQAALDEELRHVNLNTKPLIIFTTYDTFRCSEQLRGYIEDKHTGETTETEHSDSEFELLKSNAPISFKAIVADEGDVLRNKNKTYAALKPHFETSEHRIILTASPIQNNFSDLLNQLRLISVDAEAFDRLESGLDGLFKAIKEAYSQVKPLTDQEIETDSLPLLLNPFFDLKDKGYSLKKCLVDLKEVVDRFVLRLTAEDVRKRTDFGTSYTHITLPSLPQCHSLTYSADPLTQRVSLALYHDFHSMKGDSLEDESSALSIFNTSRQSRRKTPANQNRKSYLRTITDMKLVADMPDVLLRENARTEGFSDLRAGKVESLLSSLQHTLSEADTAIIAVEFTKEVVPYLQQAIEARFGATVEVRPYNGQMNSTAKRETIEWFKSESIGQDDLVCASMLDSKKPAIEVQHASRSNETALPVKKVLILACKAGQRGLNLQNNRHVYLFDGLFNPESESQIIGRSNRIGSQGQVKVFRFEGLDIETISESVRQRKALLINNVWNIDPSQFVREILNHVLIDNEKVVSKQAGPHFIESIKALLEEKVRPWETHINQQVLSQRSMNAFSINPDSQQSARAALPGFNQPSGQGQQGETVIDPLSELLNQDDPFDDGGFFDGLDFMLDDFIHS